MVSAERPGPLAKVRTSLGLLMTRLVTGSGLFAGSFLAQFCKNGLLLTSPSVQFDAILPYRPKIQLCIANEGGTLREAKVTAREPIGLSSAATNRGQQPKASLDPSPV